MNVHVNVNVKFEFLSIIHPHRPNRNSSLAGPGRFSSPSSYPAQPSPAQSQREREKGKRKGKGKGKPAYSNIRTSRSSFLLIFLATYGPNACPDRARKRERERLCVFSGITSRLVSSRLAIRIRNSGCRLKSQERQPRRVRVCVCT